MTVQPMNLSPESLMALLQALTALNLMSNVGTVLSATPSTGAITTVTGDNASPSPLLMVAPASSGHSIPAASPAATTMPVSSGCSPTAVAPAHMLSTTA